MNHAPARIVLVTGGSRGIGAQVAQHLASADTHVVVNYRERAQRANRSPRPSAARAGTPRPSARTSPTRPSAQR